MRAAAARISSCVGMSVFLAVAGCSRPDENEAMRQAYRLGEQYHWQEALPLVKPYLLAHPQDPLAHFLWGAAHLHAKQPSLEIAKGELEYALSLLRSSHDLGALRGVMSEAQFEAVIHLKAALIYMRWAHEAMAQAIAPARIDEQLRIALQHVRKGLALDPQSSTLKEMEETLSYLDKPGTEPAKESQPPAKDLV